MRTNFKTNDTAMLKIGRMWKCGREGIYFNNIFWVPVKIPHGLTWDQTQVSAVRGRIVAARSKTRITTDNESLQGRDNAVLGEQSPTFRAILQPSSAGPSSPSLGNHSRQKKTASLAIETPLREPQFRKGQSLFNQTAENEKRREAEY